MVIDPGVRVAYTFRLAADILDPPFRHGRGRPLSWAAAHASSHWWEVMPWKAPLAVECCEARWPGSDAVDFRKCYMRKVMYPETPI